MTIICSSRSLCSGEVAVSNFCRLRGGRRHILLGYEFDELIGTSERGGFENPLSDEVEEYVRCWEW